jgi:hypothetical protein
MPQILISPKESVTCLGSQIQTSTPRQRCAYADLQRYDVIEAYYDRRLKPCVVLAVTTEGDITTLKLHPLNCRNRVYPGQVRLVRVRAEHPIDILGNAKLESSLEYSKRLVLSVLQPGTEPRSTRQMQDALKLEGIRISKDALDAGCIELVKAGRLIERHHANYKSYRLLLPQEPGLVVIEHAGTRSERLGWIEEYTRHRRSGKLHPVVRWLDGTRSLSDEGLLDPTEQPTYLLWAAIVGGRALPIPPAYIPSDLLRRLDVRRSIHGTPPHAALIEVAQRLELVEPHTYRFPLGQTGANIHAKTLKYLDDYYPGWRYGLDVRLCWQGKDEFMQGAA